MVWPNADVLDLRTVDEYHSRVQSKNFNRQLAAWLSALLLVVLGAKLWVIQVYGTAVPYWDQWDEARLFFKPWLEGHLTWGAWFAPHNEHRIFFTRALDVMELWLNRQWDPILQMVINAFIHTGYACGLAYGLWIFTGRKHEGLICFLLMPFFALPFAAENTIHGFQSQVYFLGISSVVTIIGLGFGSPGGGWWFCGLATAVMSIFSMGSGLFASLAVMGLVILRTLKQRGITRNHLITFGCSLAVFVFGLVLNVTVKEHAHYRARSFLTFLDALAGNLAWPFRDQPVMLCLIGLPLIITIVKYFRSDFKDPRAAEFVLILGFWGFLQAMALAYGRTFLGNSSRYLDTLDTIPIASLASLFILGEKADFRRFPRWLVVMLVVVWVGSLFWGMWRISRTAMQDYKTLGNYLQWSKRWSLIEEENVRAFVATNDRRYLPDQPLWSIPYSNADRLIELLRDPKLSSVLPPACRPPLKLEKDGKSDASFVLDGCPPDKPKQEFTRVWGNYSTNGTKATGSFVSKPLSAELPKLIVSVCCGNNRQGIQFQLVEQSTGRRIELSPKTIGRWQTIIVTAPANPFRLEITDQSQNSWAAVGDMNELGRLSYDARLLLHYAVVILLLGLCLCVWLAGLAVLRRGIGLGDGGFAEFLVLLIALVALVSVWSGRNLDATELACKLHKELAVELASAGDLRSAEMHLRAALWLQPDDPETFCHLANVILHDPNLEKNKAREEAISNYEAALRSKPDFLEAKNQLRALGVPVAE